MKGSWRTTLTGVLVMVAAGVGYFFPDLLPVVVALEGVLIGQGFILTRDNKVSSEEAGAR